MDERRLAQRIAGSAVSRRLEISVRRSPGQDAAFKFSQLGLNFELFWDWKLDVEGRLDQSGDPTHLLDWVKNKSNDWCYQHSEIREVGSRRFRVLWDVDRNRETGQLTLMELSLIELSPKIADNSRP
jgi:hypothetical protein